MIKPLFILVGLFVIWFALCFYRMLAAMKKDLRDKALRNAIHCEVFLVIIVALLCTSVVTWLFL